MAKFRSWCEKLKVFYYFKDGYYYTDEKCTCPPHCNNFNWQNAEQSMVVADEIFYKNDIGLLVCYLLKYGKKEKTTIKGIIDFDVKGMYINTGNNKYHISDCLRFWEDVFKVIGNIHENKEND